MPKILNLTLVAIPVHKGPPSIIWVTTNYFFLIIITVIRYRPCVHVRVKIKC